LKHKVYIDTGLSLFYKKSKYFKIYVDKNTKKLLKSEFELLHYLSVNNITLWKVSMLDKPDVYPLPNQILIYTIKWLVLKIVGMKYLQLVIYTYIIIKHIRTMENCVIIYYLYIFNRIKTYRFLCYSKW